ncbi:MAG: methyl-accepting chemotaxis protein [Pseudolabrys sp.]
MSARRFSLPAKLNLAVSLPIALAFVVSAAAFVGIKTVSNDAEQVIASGHILQDANEFLMAVERTGRLMGEPGSQQQVQSRLSPEIDRLRGLAGGIAETVRRRDEVMASKLTEDIQGLDQFVLATMLARGNITESRLLFPAALGAFSETAARVGGQLRSVGSDDATKKADEFLQQASQIVERITGYSGSADAKQFEPTRGLISGFSDHADQAIAILKNAGQETRKLSRDMERARSQLFGLTTQLGGASDRFETLQPKVAEILDHAREVASLLKSDNKIRSDERLSRIFGWTNIMWLGALTALITGLVMAGGVPIFIGRSILSPLSRLETAMLGLARGDTTVAIQDTRRPDAVGAMARAAVIFRDNMAEADRLRTEKANSERNMAERRRGDMHRLAGEFQAAVGSMIDIVSSASTELEAAAGSLSGIAENTQTLSASVAGTFQQASANVQTMAATTEQLGTSIRQIARQAEESSHIAGVAVRQTQITDACISRLSDSAERIGDVVRLISSIAGQTNMLALNATIEAARAGEAGRGFSVVAQEVKTLAASTARATDEIDEQISGMQQATRESVLAIEEISKTIGRVAEIASAILSAVEEQSAATQDIARNAQHATEAARQVAASITDVSHGASATETASAAVFASVRALSAESAHLKREVETFLATVRAA